jgi:hypothetical protein
MYNYEKSSIGVIEPARYSGERPQIVVKQMADKSKANTIPVRKQKIKRKKGTTLPRTSDRNTRHGMRITLEN